MTDRKKRRGRTTAGREKNSFSFGGLIECEAERFKRTAPFGEEWHKNKPKKGKDQAILTKGSENQEKTPVKTPGISAR